MELFLARLPPASKVLDVGAGGPAEIRAITAAGHAAFVMDYALDGGHFEDLRYNGQFDGLFCSHTLEHTRNPGRFLDTAFSAIRENGTLGIVVPPLKHEIVGGHLTLWNAGLLLYHLIRAGFDCSKASVRSYDYNVAVVVHKVTIKNMPALREDNGDIEALAPYFPFPVEQGFDGRIEQWGWE